MLLSSLHAGDAAPMPVPGVNPPVVGFTAEIVHTGTLPEIRARLEELARASAFRLAGLASDLGAAGTVRAHFELRAPNASAGDAQIYSLLFALTKVMSWQTLRKEYG